MCYCFYCRARKAIAIADYHAKVISNPGPIIWPLYWGRSRKREGKNILNGWSLKSWWPGKWPPHQDQQSLDSGHKSKMCLRPTADKSVIWTLLGHYTWFSELKGMEMHRRKERELTFRRTKSAGRTSMMPMVLVQACSISLFPECML